MNAYEITFIVRPDLDEEQTRGAVTQVTGRLESAGGEIIAVYPWSPARRRMAYPIRDFGDGFYTTATFRLDSPALRDVENALKLNENILRFLVVQASEMQIRQSQQRAQQLAAAAAAPLPAQQPPAAAPTPAQQSDAPVTAQQPAIVPTVPEQTVESPDGADVVTEPVPTAGDTQPAGEAVTANDAVDADVGARPLAESVATTEGEE